MKHSEIQIGQRYVHVNYPNTIYLGAGQKGQMTQLVIIEGCSVGNFVALPEDKASLEFWQGFRKDHTYSYVTG